MLCVLSVAIASVLHVVTEGMPGGQPFAGTCDSLVRSGDYSFNTIHVQ